MVGKSSPKFSASKIRCAYGGGSSSSFSSEFAASFINAADVMMKIFACPSVGMYCAR